MVYEKTLIVGNIWVRGIKNERGRAVGGELSHHAMDRTMSLPDVVRIGRLPRSRRDPVEPSQQLSAVAEDKEQIQRHLFLRD